MQFKINLIPIAASRPRVTRYSTYYAEPYNSYKDILKVLIGKEVAKTKRPLFKQYEPLKLRVIFFMPIPKNTSKKKRESLVWHTKKPDADNLLKAIKDAMNEIVYHDDGQVCEINVEKLYSENPRTEITIYKLST